MGQNISRSGNSQAAQRQTLQSASASAAAAAPSAAGSTEQAHYLLLDHGGVLDGQMVMNEDIDRENDLVLKEFDGDMAGFTQVLRQGVAIVNMLDELVEQHGYKIVFHSANSQADQLYLLSQLQKACTDKCITFPAVHAMGVLDREHHATTRSMTPDLSKSLSGIQIATWGADQDVGKTSLRRALSVLLRISPDQCKNHVVFDDGPSICPAAEREGYQVHLIGDETPGKTLHDAVKETLDSARENRYDADATSATAYEGAARPPSR